MAGRSVPGVADQVAAEIVAILLPDVLHAGTTAS
ncbi:hypothetical protein ABH927_005788 [Planotetraspora sp. GP83]